VEKVKKQMGINKGFAPILFENKVFDEIDLPKYLKSVDCLVSPTMGEGFNLPGLQCMALGIPVIVTNFSGCQDYANDKTATLLEPNGFVFRNNMDNIPQFRNKKWAFLEVNKIQKAMRYIFKNQKKAEMKSNWAYSEVRNKFNYKVIGNTFTNIIREIYG
jgi:glycosyltransferase involved in cell wall biosynthesis